MFVRGQMRWALFWSSLKVGAGAVCLLIVRESRLGLLGIPLTDGPKLWPERCASGIQPAASPIHSLVSFPTQFLSLCVFVFANSLSFSFSASHFLHLSPSSVSHCPVLRCSLSTTPFRISLEYVTYSLLNYLLLFLHCMWINYTEKHEAVFTQKTSKFHNQNQPIFSRFVGCICKWNMFAHSPCYLDR